MSFEERVKPHDEVVEEVVASDPAYLSRDGQEVFRPKEELTRDMKLYPDWYEEYRYRPDIKDRKKRLKYFEVITAEGRNRENILIPIEKYDWLKSSVYASHLYIYNGTNRCVRSFLSLPRPVPFVSHDGVTLWAWKNRLFTDSIEEIREI
jgi:hypothetical protein